MKQHTTGLKNQLTQYEVKLFFRIYETLQYKCVPSGKCVVLCVYQSYL